MKTKETRKSQESEIHKSCLHVLHNELKTVTDCIKCHTCLQRYVYCDKVSLCNMQFNLG